MVVLALSIQWIYQHSVQLSLIFYKLRNNYSALMIMLCHIHDKLSLLDLAEMFLIWAFLITHTVPRPDNSVKIAQIKSQTLNNANQPTKKNSVTNKLKTTKKRGHPKGSKPSSQQQAAKLALENSRIDCYWHCCLICPEY